MDKNNVEKCINALTTKAEQAVKSEDALRFSQAACNVANAFAQLQNVLLEKR